MILKTSFGLLFSDDYPYKEVLDLLATRCYSDRTNAWTATDHTCYTIYSAGSGGFLNILPVYLDHILFPLLRDEDFLTEVHHITADGEDSGVVYSEMQARSDWANYTIFISCSRFGLGLSLADDSYRFFIAICYSICNIEESIST